MTYRPSTFSDDLITLPKLPGWVTSGRAETFEAVAFRSGAVHSHLHLVEQRDDVPQALLRRRLALRVSEACGRYPGARNAPQNRTTRSILCAPGTNREGRGRPM